MGWVDLLLIIYIVFVCGGIWFWPAIRRRPFPRSRYEVHIINPDKQHSPYLIERKD